MRKMQGDTTPHEQQRDNSPAKYNTPGHFLKTTICQRRKVRGCFLPLCEEKLIIPRKLFEKVDVTLIFLKIKSVIPLLFYHH